MRMEMNFWLALSTNGDWTRLCHKWNNFCRLWLRFGCAWLWLAEQILQKWRLFIVFVVKTRLFGEAIRGINSKRHNFRFSIPKRNVQNVVARFAFTTLVTAFIIFFPCVDTNTLLSWVVASRTIHISKNILNWLSRLFKNINPRPDFKKIEFVCSSKLTLRTWHKD